MHLVFLNQYYPPDAAPTGVMLEGLAAGLIERGHEVTVLCAAGGYAGAESGVSENRCFSESVGSATPHATSETPRHRNTETPKIHRIRTFRFGRGTFLGKLADYASYYLGVGWKLGIMRPRPERIVAMTTPPYLSVLARLMSKLRGADHAHWVMDVYPDVMAAHGMVDDKGLVYRILSGMARWGMGGRRCAAVLTIGPDMAERVGKRVGKRVISDRLSVVGEKQNSGIEDRGSRMVDGKAEALIPDSSSSIHNPRSAESVAGTAGEATVPWVPLWSAEAVVGVSSSVSGEEAGSGIEDRGLTMADGETDEPWSRSASPIHNPQSIVIDPTSSLPDPRSTISDPPSSIAARALRAVRGWGDGELVVMYSGNMGLGHRFGEILAAAKILKEESPTGRDANVQAYSFRSQRDNHGAPGRPAHQTADHGPRTSHPPPRFVFFGGGKRRAEVEMFIRENPGCAVELHDYTPADHLANHLRSADVHLASLDAAWTGTMVPSKVQGIFAAGRPMIFIGSADSSIGRWVHESGGGWVVAPGDVGGLLAALAAADDPAVRSAMGRAARSFAHEHFDKATNIARIATVLAGG